jgi:Tfp pilus assembly protein PilZ
MQEIINILNRDPNAIKLLKELNQAAARTGATVKEYEKAREIIVLLSIYRNPQAMQVLSEVIWEQIQA